MHISRTQRWLLLALLVSNTIILFGQSIWLDWPRFLAAVAMTFVLPGWAWLPALGWLQTKRGIERIVLLIGLSSLLSALALFVILFLPGPFTETPTLIGLNLAILTGVAYHFIQNRQSGQRYTARGTPASEIQNLARGAPAKSKIEWPSRTILLILLAILAVAAFIRLARLGYAEFHEDELENMRLIVRAYKGEEYAPFLDSKGPIHWLLPAALWYLNGWINEGVARTPFAITALTLIPLMYVLGKRMSDGRDQIGLIAAGFVAVNGFYVAYARYVENQSLIVFWGALAMWFAYRYYKEELNHFLIFVALALAIGLIAHPDVLLYLPVFAYIIGLKLWQQRADWRQQSRWLIVAGLLFGGLVAAFYIPYLFDPRIGLIYQYFVGDRLGESLFYNRVANLFDQDQLYTTRFHAPLLVLLLVWLLARQFGQWRWPGWLILGGLGVAIVTTVVWPERWGEGQVNLAFTPYALLTFIFILLPRTDFELKAIFLWFSVPLGALLFLAKDAADHIQIAYTAWALLAALALVDLWAVLSQPIYHPAPAATPTTQESMLGLVFPWFPWPPTKTAQAVKTVLVIALAAIIGLILFYQYMAFNSTVTAYWRVKLDSANNSDSIYNRLYGSIPRPRKIFSNPRLGGWKAVGYLWATGKLSGDFRSINESFAVPIWYTFQTPRSCYEDPQNYWVRRGWNGWPDEEQMVLGQGYTLTGIVLVDQEPKLHLYEKGAPAGVPEIIDSEAYRQKFDRLATPSRFAQEKSGAYKTAFNFGGDQLRLIGYDLPSHSFQPGDLLPITVYWETLAPMELRYRAFMHLVDKNGELWAQHDDDPACRLPTQVMRPGQRSSRQFRIPIDPATPPGDYTIRLGLYHPNTLERLGIWDAEAEQPAGNSLTLGQVKIE